MIKITKIMVVVGLTLTQFLFSTDLNKVVNNKEEKQVEAANVTLPEIPRVRDIKLLGRADVSNATEFIAAYTNENISDIQFTTDITLTEVETATVYDHKLARDLIIQGPRVSSTSAQAKFLTTGNTFHIVTSGISLYVINLNIGTLKTDASSVFITDEGNAIGGNEIVLNISGESGNNNKWNTVVKSNNQSNLFLVSSSVEFDNVFAKDIKNLILTWFYSDSSGTNLFEAKKDGNAKVYIHERANVNTHNIKEQTFKQFVEVNIYNGAALYMNNRIHPTSNLIKSENVNGVIYRVDSDAIFKVNNEKNPAIMEEDPNNGGSNKFEFYSNPGALVEFIGSSTTKGAINFTNPDSKIVLNSPKYFDVQNTQTGNTAFTTTQPRSDQLQIYDANIGLWAKGSANKDVNPLLPTPFLEGNGSNKKVNLIAGNTTMDATSSAEFNSMPGGYSTDKYNRIATSVKPIFNVSDLTLDVADAPTAIVKELIEPASAEWSYTGYDSSIISIDSNGVVTPKKAGRTEVNVLATSIRFYKAPWWSQPIEQVTNYTSTKTITVTVSGPPTMTVNPPVISLPLNSTITDYYSGVSAVDSGGDTLTVTKTGDVNTAVSGIYPITYSATDALNKTATAKRNYAIGRSITSGNYTIFAENFTKRVSEVITTDAAIITAANVKVFDNTTGLQVPNNTLTLTIDKDTYTNVVGEYPIRISTNVENTDLSIEVTGGVVSGNIPILSGLETKSVELNAPFNSMDGVSASDVEDGNITNKIMVDGTVNTKVAGVYLLTYTLTDSDGNSVTVDRSVIVNDGSFVIDGIYAIAAHDFKIREDLFDASDEALIKAANVKVFNLTDGTEIANPKITVSTTGFSKKVGEYSITFSFNPKITVRANVVANLSPELTVPFMEVKQGATINPMDGVVAIDAEDGDLINEVTYGALPDTNKLGVHKLQYSLTDTFGNTTTKTRVILVNDGKHIVNGSYIFKAHDFSINQSSLIDTSEELVKLSGLEIYSTTSGEKVTTGYNVNDGGYSRAPGKYTITFTMGDGSVSVVGSVVNDGIKLPQSGSENGLIYLLLISTLAFRLFKRRA